MRDNEIHGQKLERSQQPWKPRQYIANAYVRHCVTLTCEMVHLAAETFQLRGSQAKARYVVGTELTAHHLQRTGIAGGRCAGAVSSIRGIRGQSHFPRMPRSDPLLV